MECTKEWKSTEEKTLFARLTEEEQRQLVEYSMQVVLGGWADCMAVI